jgi:asparagine synthase (glutamine-hydrolysing)
MCGISGIASRNSLESEKTNKMIQAIHHRGPDGSGFHVGKSFALGMCRLSIIDVQGGKQPYISSDSKVSLVFNGEIYNFKEIRQELASLGVKFTTASEIEVLHHAYVQWKLEFVHKLRGMFAIALVDEAAEQVVLIRDRLGKKPLVYSLDQHETLYFGSEVKALLAAGVKADPDFEAISNVYRRGYPGRGKTGFTSIQSLPPASILTYQDGHVSVKQYWQPNTSRETKVDFKTALTNTTSILEESVRLRLNAERPLGVFLSGGYDSSLVAALATKLHSGDVSTYSIGFRDRKYDESKFAAQVAQALGTKHHNLIVEPDPLLIVDELAHCLDQPFADSSIIPTYLLNQFAAQNVVVAVGGDGGDETFAGYDRYLATPFLQRINPLLGVANFAISNMPSTITNRFGRKGSRLIQNLTKHPNIESRYSQIMNLMQPEVFDQLVIEKIKTTQVGSDPYLTNLLNYNKLDATKSLRNLDLTEYLPEDLLYKADIASMAHGVEVRSPLLDHVLIDYVSTLPTKYLIKGLTTKYLLKQITHQFIPEKLLNRPKMGFAIPRASWLRNELKEIRNDYLLDQTGLKRGWINQAELLKVLALHDAGIDQDQIIWPLLMVEIWARTWIDQPISFR